jgi:benzoyl-CoA reductase/2-hydroxyglutaryl-CoA dehydratase subunit BcrC/BadD/HgdB
MNLPKRMDIVRRLREENKRIALVFPVYYPQALLRSFDIQPIEIWNADDVDLSLSNSHIQSYTCSIARILLSFVLDERYRDYYDMIFIPHTCDTFQQVGSLLTDFIKIGKPLINFYLPKRKDKISIDFCNKELIRIIGLLEAFTGKRFDPDRLKIEIEKEMRLNSVMLGLFEKREYLELSDSDFYRLIFGRTYIPVEEYTEIVEKIIEDSRLVEKKDKKRIFISGITPEPLSLLDIIDQNNACVSFDDLAVSERRIFEIDNLPEDPLTSQSLLMLNTLPDAIKGSPIELRAERILKKAERFKTRGGIFYIMKFCEVEYFDYPQIRNYLIEHGIKTFLVEYELKKDISRQNINRIQAFIEGL